ncbi:MAG: NADH-quinone oxidoreductase subunit N [Planctomycetales bacterium]|nr:NADH-quinone oxidoreductase subunit N [Planctomycetales bacterium]
MLPDLTTIKDLLPEISLIALAMWIYIGGTIATQRQWWSWFSLAAYVVVGFMLYKQDLIMWPYLSETDGGAVTGPLVIDYLGHATRWIAVAMGFVFTLMSSRLIGRRTASEFLATLMLLVVGVMIVARANDLVLMFLGLELVSIPTYVLLFLGRGDRSSAEATTKYFFLSILSSAVLLYGFSFLYGMAGTTVLMGTEGNPGIREMLGTMTQSEVADGLGRFAPFALILILAGLGFRLAAVPFHFYAPDVYQGTTNANAGLLTVAPKIVGIVGIIRLIVATMPLSAHLGWQLVIVLSILTMTIGNVAALWQKNLRRLMAYSSIAHAGYMLIGLTVALAGRNQGLVENGGVAAMYLYLLVYVVASAGIFAALSFLSSEDREVNTLDDISGVASRHPAIAGAVALFMFSLAGIPPLAGFWGKFSLFGGAISAAANVDHAATSSWLITLAIVGVLNAAIAAAYYLRVIATMYFYSSSREEDARGGWEAAVATGLCAFTVVALGILPGSIMRTSRLAEQSAIAGTTVKASSTLAAYQTDARVDER